MIDEIYQRSITVGASVILVTLAVPLVRVVGGRPGGLVRFACLTIDGALISLMALSLYWFASVYDELESGLYDFLRDDIVVGAGGLLAVLELTRRAFGWPLAVLSLLCIAYALFGEDLPWIEAQRFADIARSERAAGNRLRSSVKASADAQAQAQAAVRAAHARAARLLRALADRPAPDGACPRGCIVDVPTDPD